MKYIYNQEDLYSLIQLLFRLNQFIETSYKYDDEMLTATEKLIEQVNKQINIIQAEI